MKKGLKDFHCIAQNAALFVDLLYSKAKSFNIDEKDFIWFIL